ncbi:MAG: VPLPA-CTERM sorting domain-containing protein [Boseongicola sp.]
MKLLLAASVLALSAGVASAATYTFHFSNTYLVGGGAQNKTFRSVEDAGITVDVSGYYYNLGLGGSYVQGGGADVDLNSYGLISQNGNEYHAIDSWGPNESMMFSFGMDVELLGTYISWAAGEKDWDVFMDGILQSVENGSGPKALGYGLADNFAIGTRTHYSLCPTVQTFTSVPNCDSENSAIKIKKIKIDYTPEVIPLPAAGWLMLAGIGGIAALRRRKS